MIYPTLDPLSNGVERKQLHTSIYNEIEEKHVLINTPGDVPPIHTVPELARLKFANVIRVSRKKIL